MKPTRHQLQLAGWFSIVSAIITVPLFALSVASLIPAFTTGNNNVFLANTLFFIFHVGLYAYIYLTFRDYLKTHFSFDALRTPINILVGITVFSAAMQAVSFIFEEAATISSTLAFIILIPLGIVSVIIGLRLLRLKEDFFALRNTLSYLFIFTGVAIASVILLLPGILLGIVLDTFLGIALIRASEERLH